MGLLYADQAATSHPLLFPASSTVTYANASSTHALGRAARTALEDARRRVSAAVALPVVLFTASGTEGNNLVLQQPAWRFIITVATEHHSVYYAAQHAANRADPPCAVAFLTVDSQGRLADVDELARLLSGRFATGTGLVSLAYVNNETGTVLDLAAVGRAVRNANGTRPPGERVYLHTDAVQAPGHVPVRGDAAPLDGVDFLTLAAHKFHGPGGVGILACRSRDGLHRPLCFGGSQEGGLRPGTESVAGIVAAAAALEDANDPARLAERLPHLRRMTDALWAVLMPYIVAGVVLPTGSADPAQRAPHHVSFCVRNAHRTDLVARMEQRFGVLVSSGSACSTDVAVPSHVLDAMRIPPEFIQGSLRITLSHLNTMEEVTGRIGPALVALLG